MYLFLGCRFLFLGSGSLPTCLLYLFLLVYYLVPSFSRRTCVVDQIMKSNSLFGSSPKSEIRV